MSVLYLTADLLFSSQVTSAARQLGLDVTLVNSSSQLLATLAAENAHLLIIDFTTPDLNLLELIPTLREQAPTEITIIVYGPHVDTASTAAAKQAGCDMVYTRGQFSSQMVDILRRHGCTV